MDDVLDLLGGCVEALAASAASRAKRNAAADRLIPPPSPGTPLLVSLALAVEHSGVYLGGGRVAELQDDGRVVAVSLTDFVNGSPGAFPAVRTGTRIFAACDAKTRKPIGSIQSLRSAKAAAAGRVRLPYDLVRNNCHRFVAACAQGADWDGRGFGRMAIDAAASVGWLERLLAKRLNGGKAIAWCAVARSRERFNYGLTGEKIARLRLEGKIK